MWFFGTRGNPRVNKRLSALEEDLERLERTLKGLRADMDLQWEKVARGLGRLAKRTATMEQATAQEEPAADGAPMEDGSFLDAQMTPRQRQIQASILAARTRH